ncbi:MAG: PIN domain-containing protein [Rhodoferax sp.]|nr:PIN domain-containing protein [Rhodoferax sp.]
MILVDSSVWIDFFSDVSNTAVDRLDALLKDSSSTLATADLVVYEVLRGFRKSRALMDAQALMSELTQVELGGLANALQAADHYRSLRAMGYSIRSPIDVLLASYCITHGHLLLHRDADFDVLQTLRGLQVLPH